jgi:hypothetical protein
MPPTFVLVHSPSVGPSTWRPVAGRLAALGREAIVPSLLGVAQGRPPYWPRVVEAVAGALATGADARPGGPSEPATAPILVAHSNAGLFLPAIVAGLGGRVAGCVFVDAGLPPRSGEAALAPPELLALLRDKAVDGLLPPWTRWWDEEVVAKLFPDEATRRMVTEDEPRLPLAYYEATIPVPAGWDDRPCAYVLFGRPYEALAEEARARGWPVRHLPGRHLHQLVDPGGLARLLVELADAAGGIA